MQDEEKICLEKWHRREFLAYLEGDLDNSDSAKLEAHLKSCEICSSEFESLRKMNALLKHHTDVFHPDEQQLYRYVTQPEDSDGEIALHLVRCESCREDVALLKEMINSRSDASSKIPAMPLSLLRKIGQLHSRSASQSKLKSLYLIAAEFISAPLKMPRLALGTAAAVIVLVIISFPLWQSYHKIPSPDSNLAITETPAQKPSEAILHEEDKSHQNLYKDETSKRSSAEPGDRNGALSPEPAMKFSPQKKLEKPLDGEQGPISPTPAAVPEQVPTSVGTKEKSRSPAARMAERSEKESASPRASKPRMPASPMKKQDATHQYSAVERMRPEAQAPSASASDPRIPIRIRIVDSEGRSIPGFRFQAPANVSSRYRFEGDTESETADLILIRVKSRHGSVDLSAELFKAGSTDVSRTAHAQDITTRDLQDKVASLISSLLETH